MQEVTKCPVCGATPFFTITKPIKINQNSTNIYEKEVEEYAIRLGKEEAPREIVSGCKNCFSVFRGKFFTDDEIKEIYGQLYFELEEQFAGEDAYVYNDVEYMDACAQNMLSSVRRIEKEYDHRIVEVFDIGGRDGFRLKYLVQNGYNCTVFDPIAGKPCDDRINKQNLWSSQIPTGQKADLIILFDVLEHCPNPHAMIDDCRNHLREGGYLLIEVPYDIESFFDWIFFGLIRRKNLVVDYTHNIFYSLRSLTLLVERGGLNCRQRKFQPLPKFGTPIIEVLCQKTGGVSSRLSKGLSIDFDFFRSGYLFRLFGRIVRKITSRLAALTIRRS